MRRRGELTIGKKKSVWLKVHTFKKMPFIVVNYVKCPCVVTCSNCVDFCSIKLRSAKVLLLGEMS